MSLLETNLKYNVNQTIFVAVDCAIFGFDSKSLKLLLFKRKVEPLKGHWSLIGAFIQDDLSIDEGAKQVLLESTGLSGIYLNQLKTYGDKDRDPGARVISVGYYSLIPVGEYEISEVEEYDAKWFELNELPELILDHRQMVDDAIDAIRTNARSKPIGFNLLPPKFTLPMLQTLYESIFQRTFDQRNFRKKILGMGILDKTNEKDKSTSKKGAFLYSFNKEAYDDKTYETFI
jgi:hypothetical protein